MILDSQINTKVFSDGQSFSLEVTNGSSGEYLLFSGVVFVVGNNIEISGTTNAPNSVITLFFNNGVMVVVNSDINGEWKTYVSADQLGLEWGTKNNIIIEAIAAKNNLISNRVEVGRLDLNLVRGGIIADFKTTVSESKIIIVIKEIQKEWERIITQQEEEIQTTLTVAAPIVIASSAPLWGYLPYLPTLMYHFFTYLIGFVGRRKKRGVKYSGVVYDSITKEPLVYAILRVYEKSTKKLVATEVTNKQGGYHLLLEPGKYFFEVKKPQYKFPSKILTASVDGHFQHLYDQKAGLVVNGDQLIVPDVPVDQINFKQQWHLAGFGRRFWLAVQTVGGYVALPLLGVGSVLSIAVVSAIPENPINWVLAFVYVGLFLLQLKLRPKQQKAWGVVYDVTSNAVLPLTTIQLIDPEYGKVVTSRLSDYQGRFAFLPDPGSYVVKATKPGYEQTEVVEEPEGRTSVAEQVEISKPNQRITGDVGMRARP